MRVVIRPSLSPDRELDIAPALIGAVAHELWKHCGGNEVLNWLEAERILARLLAGMPPEPVRTARSRSAQGPTRRRPARAASKAVPAPKQPV